MSTTGIATWAVDLKDVAAVYPFQGTEVILTIVGVATWLIWHIWCMRWESHYNAEKIRKYGKNIEAMRKAIDQD